MANHLFYTVSSRTTATLRAEVFDDYDGFRTGFEGLYTEVTGGLVAKLRAGPHRPPRAAVRLQRPEPGLQPGPGPVARHQFTAACDVILRW